MSKMKISKPSRLEKTGVTDSELDAWKNELLNYMAQDSSLDDFLEDGAYAEWTAAEDNKHRIETFVAPDTATELPKRRRQLHNFLTVVAGCCYRDH